VAAGHFDADNIKAKQVQLAERYRALNDPMQARRQKLRDALRLQQFYRDVEDEEDWIREKEPIAASANRGLYMTFSSHFMAYSLVIALSIVECQCYQEAAFFRA